MQGELILSAKEKNTYFKLDPRTKLFLMLTINSLFFCENRLTFMLAMAMIPFLLLLAEKNIKAALGYGVFYTLAAFASIYLVPLTHGVANIVVVACSGLLHRMLPGLIMGYYLVTTTTVSEFVAAMERMHIPKKIIIPMCVMFRFFPTVKEEAYAISDAMRMRGISFGAGEFLKKPVAMLEYRLVPLLMSTVKIGDELSAASLTRGLGNPVKRTNICKIGFGIMDALLSATAIFALAGFFIL